MLNDKSRAQLSLVERSRSRRLVQKVEHRPVVHGVSGGDPCRCTAECACGARVLLPSQVATFFYNHAEPGPRLRELEL